MAIAVERISQTHEVAVAILAEISRRRCFRLVTCPVIFYEEADLCHPGYQ
jgi:hypothetical protein